MRMCNCDNPCVSEGSSASTGGGSSYIIFCLSCGATTGYFDIRQDAVDAWDMEEVTYPCKRDVVADEDRLDDIDREYYDETGELPMVVVTDGVHCVGISVYTSDYVEWLKEQI